MLLVSSPFFHPNSNWLWGGLALGIVLAVILVFRTRKKRNNANQDDETDIILSDGDR